MVGRTRRGEHHRMRFCVIRFFILLISASMWKRERELWMRPRTLEGWGNEVLPETVQHQKNLLYLSANVRPFWRWNDWGRSRREEKGLNRKRKRPKATATSSFRLLTALSLLLIMAGDVELNPGPLGDGTHLGPDDLREVLKELWEVSNKWYNIGLEFGLSVDALKNIKQQNPDQHDALREMLSIWLDGVGSLPTWAALADALESRIVGAKLLAAELRKTYCSNPVADPISGALARGTLSSMEETVSLERMESHGTTSEPSGTTSEPSGTSSEPSGTTSEPSGTTSEPIGTTSEPSGTTSEPSGTSSEPRGPSEPSGTSSEPRGPSEPSGTSSEPCGPSEPSGTTSEPSGTSSEPRGPSEPRGTSSEPRGPSEPSGTSSEPRGPSEPSGTSSEPRGPSEPSGTSSEPSGTSSEPRGPSEPSRTTSEPSGISSEPRGPSESSGTTSEPSATSSESDISGSVKSGDKDPSHNSTPSQPSARMSGLPFLDAENLKDWEKDTLKGRLLEESEKMMFIFQNLVTDTSTSLTQRGVSPGDLIKYLNTLGGLDPAVKRVDKSPFDNRLKELKSADSIGECFFIIRDYLSFFNYRTVEHIIQKLGTDEDQLALKSYKEKLADYCKRRAFECPPNVFGLPSGPDHDFAVVKLDEKLEQFTLEQLQRFQSNLSNIIGIPRYTLRLISVERGCMKLTFQIPSFMKDLAFPLSAEQERALQAEGVLWLKCGSYHFPGQSLGRGHERDQDSNSDSDDEGASQAPQQEELSLYTAYGYKRVPIHSDSTAEQWNNDFKSVTSQVSRNSSETMQPSALKEFLLRQSHILYPESKYIDPFLLAHADSVPEILDTLSPQFINFLNWSLLLQISDAFNLPSRYIIEEYTSQFPPSTRLKTLPDPLSEEEIVELHGVKRLTVTCEGGGSDWTIGDVWQVQEALEKATGINKVFLPFAYWESSYSLHDFTFLIPSSAVGILEELCKEDLEILANSGIISIDIDYNQALSFSKEADKVTQPPIQVQDESRVRTKDLGLEHLIPGSNMRQMSRKESSYLTDLISSTPQGKLQEKCLDEDLHDLAKTMQSWKELAPYFGINEWRVKEIEENYPNEDDQKYQALICWKGIDPGTATYEGLVECLLIHGHVSDAAFLLGSLQQALPPFVQKAQHKLRLIYTDTHSVDNLWPGAPKLMEFNRCLAVNRLELCRDHSTIKYEFYDGPKKDMVSLKALLIQLSESKKSQTFILRGPIRSGITMLMKQVCASWANQYALREFPLVLYIDVKSSDPDATLQDFVQSQFPGVVTKDVWQWIYKRKGKGVLFILDGCESFEGQDFVKSKVIVTCTKHLPFNTGRVNRLELLGLSDAQIAKQAVTSLGPDQAGDLLLYLSENAVIKSLVSTPVYLASVIYVFTHAQPDQLPTTLTQLFAALTYLLALTVSVKELKLPLGFTPQALVQDKELKGLAASQYGAWVLFRNNLTEVVVIQQISQLGFDAMTEVFHLLQLDHFHKAITTKHTPSANTQYFTFTVPLLREFLVALWIHSQSQYEILMSIKYKKFPHLWQFFAGLSNTTAKEIHSLLRDNLRNRTGIVKCLLESAGGDVMNLEPPLVYNIIPDMEKEVCNVHCIVQTCMYPPHTKIDCTLMPVTVWELSRCLAIPCHLLQDNIRFCCVITSLSLKENKISDLGASVLSEMLKVNQSLKELDLGENEISDRGTSVLSEMMKGNQSLEALYLSWNKITDVGASVLGEMLKVNQSLKALDLSGNKITDAGASLFGKVLKVTKSLEALDLSQNEISDQGSSVLGKTLKVNESLNELNLSWNKISDRGASVLGKALKVNKSLRELDLSGNEISDDGASVLGEMLKVNESLKELRLSGNRISDVGASVYGEMLKVNQSLKQLDLSGNEISPDAALVLGVSLMVNQSLKELNLRRNINSDNSAIVLDEILNVKWSLRLHHRGISNRGASVLSEMLKENQSLFSLDLSGNKITDRGASVLGEMLKVNQSLKALYLGGNMIADDGASVFSKMLKVNQSLEELDLSWNKITDVGASVLGEMLKVNQSLKELDLSGNTIFDLGASVLSEMLKVNQSLKELDLGQCEISDRGTSVLGEMLEANHSLEALDLSGNKITDRGASVLGEMLEVNQSLKKLDLSQNKISHRRASVLGKMLKMNQSLEELNLSQNKISYRGASVLGKMLKMNQSLTKLNLSWNKISDRGASVFGEALKVNQTLKQLDLSGNEISPDAALVLGVSLMVNQSLKELNLRRNINSDNSAIVLDEILKVKWSLKILHLSHRGISDRGVSVLSEMLKENQSLFSLDLSWNRISDAGTSVLGEMLKVNKSLETLDLSRNEISDRGASVFGEALKVNESLKELNLSGNRNSDRGASGLGKALKVNQTLKQLDGNEISDVGASVLGEALKVNQTLKQLDLSGNRISDDGASVLGEMLKVNESLKELRLSGNRISDVGASVFGEALKVNKSLKKLDLSGNEISPDAALVLGVSLMVNQSLKELNLGRNINSDNSAIVLDEIQKMKGSLKILNLSHRGISDRGASELSEMLKEIWSLEELNRAVVKPGTMEMKKEMEILSGNRISDDGTLALGKMLKANQTLQELNLSRNELSDHGASILGEMLKVNQSLKKLNLCGNRITHRGVAVLAEMLKVNESLVKLNLSGNGISDRGASVLGEALKVNKSLRELNFSGNMITYSGASALGDMLTMNKSLQELDLSGTGISDRGASVLGEMLKVNESLKELGLSSIRVSDHGASVLGELLKVNQSLVKLDLSWNKISDRGASVFGEALKVNKSLKQLDLSGNEISPDAALVLGVSLMVNQSLKELNLRRNINSDNSAIVLDEILKVKWSLKILNLSHRGISDDGASVLSEMLKENRSLEELDLSRNGISHLGATALGEMLKVNKSLVKLDLSENCISNHGASVLSEMLKGNQSLKELNLSGNKISDHGISVFSEEEPVTGASWGKETCI